MAFCFTVVFFFGKIQCVCGLGSNTVKMEGVWQRFACYVVTCQDCVFLVVHLHAQPEACGALTVCLKNQQKNHDLFHRTCGCSFN